MNLAASPQRANHFSQSFDPQYVPLLHWLEGKRNARGPGLGTDVCLTNNANHYVGAPHGHHLSGTIDFQRIARSTLADSKTTIEELYAWEFNEPFLYDFTGRQRPPDGGYAGAIDAGTD